MIGFGDVRHTRLRPALHAGGARVIVSARNTQALEQFTHEHPGAIAIALDVTDAVAVREASRQVNALGPLDGMVYCAGRLQVGAVSMKLARSISLSCSLVRLGWAVRQVISGKRKSR